MREPAHIALFASWYPTDPEALNGNFCRAFALLLARRCRVSVIHVEMDAQSAQVEFREFADGNMQVYLARVPRRSGFLFAPLNQWSWIRAYARLLQLAEKRSGKADLFHAEVVWKAGLAAWWLARKHNTPFVVREHWTGYYPTDPQLSGWKARLHRFILRRADAVAAVSAPLAAALQQWGARPKVAVIPNAVELPEMVKGLSTEILRFVHVTNFREEQKQTRKVIQTFLQFRETNPNAELHVVGRGSEALQEEWRTSAGVHFTGPLQRDALSHLYAGATALISYSRFETFAMSVAEALVCGTPVIYTACGGPESYVEPDMGQCVDPDNPATLLAAMQALSDNSKAYNRAGIAARAREMFDHKALRDAYTRWILSV